MRTLCSRRRSGTPAPLCGRKLIFEEENVPGGVTVSSWVWGGRPVCMVGLLFKKIDTGRCQLKLRFEAEAGVLSVEKAKGA
eukprot:5728762-Pleurochrysis_carterae.AAC.1